MSELFTYRYMDKGKLGHLCRRIDSQKWFGAGERGVYASFAAKTRSEEWTAGRLLAKQLILDMLEEQAGEERLPGPAGIQIFSRNGLGESIPPQVVIAGRLAPLSLSIAHSKRAVLVALARDPNVSIGADVAAIEVQRPGFSALWLTDHERAWVQRQGEPRLVSMLWAIKEAAYKATNTSQRFVPRRIEVRFDEQGECSLLLGGCELEQEYNIFSDRVDEQVIVIVTIVSSYLGGNS